MKNVILLCLIFVGFIAGCISEIPTDEGELITEIMSVSNQIQEITKDIYCTEYSHCQSIPIGHKSCGGPGDYQIYSSLIGTRKIKKLEKLSKRSQDLGMQYNKLTMALSDCMFNDPPRTFCIQNTCGGRRALIK